MQILALNLLLKITTNTQYAALGWMADWKMSHHRNKKTFSYSKRLSSCKGFHYRPKCNCTVVVEGQWTGGKRIRLRDIKYVPSINAEPTSLLYISLPVCDFLTWWSYCIPLTPRKSHVRKHNHRCSLLHPKVEMSINTRLGLYGRTRLITEVSGSG